MEITAVNFKQRVTNNFSVISNFTSHLCFIELVIRNRNQITKYYNLTDFKIDSVVIQVRQSQKDYFRLRVD
jgi:hypothetical protein